jgi:hypothetical protein
MKNEVFENNFTRKKEINVVCSYDNFLNFCYIKRYEKSFGSVACYSL